jgi:3-isopropylmalate dehydrogenase
MTYRIAVMAGDGVGPEIVAQGLRVLEAVAGMDGFEYELTDYPHGADHYRATGELITPETIDEIGSHDALFVGAFGDPTLPEGLIERQVSMTMNLRLDLSTNVRPGRLYHSSLTPLKDYEAGDIDIAIVRESAEDCFAAPGGIVRMGTPDEVAIGLLVYTRKAVERTARHAFEMAGRRTGRLLLVTQANAVPSHSVWTRTTDELSGQYPDVTVRRLYADSGSMALITEPENIDVVLTTAWIGGIMADLLGAVVGGIGMIGSARLNLERNFGLFESAHGSAPRHAGKNRVSPMATLSALAMMLAHLGETKAAGRIDRAIESSFRSGRVPSASTRSPVGTIEATDAVIEAIEHDG